MNLRTKLTLGTLVLVSVIAAACAGNSNGSFSSPTTPTPSVTPTPTPAPVPVADVTIDIVGMEGDHSYSPNPAFVKVGQSVSWTNSDSIEHTATADDGSFDTDMVSPGGTSNPIVMSKAGTFTYHCAIHGFAMTGTLTVQ